ncbi:HVO_A0556 family zinc finger protein [Natronorubrum thiooxidans]|uniref:Uncharacterized protein n=1 Tax=Natronorubrum thiooxidans TaxID=308853 RepID=A0A1N7DP54_9EURY|nr:HVO_A0556 family zinc finger protein [Natronorubrum thiooxidans]SIR77569.1 hypothetical protein SAMN05421752_102408 [Natronorubrum thiooxidans]
MAKLQSSRTGDNGQQVLMLLEGRSCPYCTAGELKRGTYKDNRAVICDHCETPHAQLW